MKKICTGVLTGTTDLTVTQREKDHAALARRATAEGMVLLQNKNHFLPLSKTEPVALYGSGVYKTIKGGTGSGDVNERESVSIYTGMKRAGFSVSNEKWVQDYAEIYDSARTEWIAEIRKGLKNHSDTMDFFGFYCSHPFLIPTGPVPVKASGETAIYVLSRVAGEGADRHAERGDYYLTKEEEKFLEAVCSLYAHVVLLINTGGVVDLSFLKTYPNIESVLLIGQPGMEGGNAVADILCGAVNPSGKLTDTWAYRYEDYPAADSFSHNNGDVERALYVEDIYVGYRYFDTFRIPVLFGFGEGLSYTDFDINVYEVSAKALKAGVSPVICVEAEVTNTGKCAGREVVQVYVSAPGKKQDKAFRELVAFAKTKVLQPGEKECLEISFDAGLMASYSEEAGAWGMEAGTYVFWVGASLAQAKVVGGYVLEKDIITEKTTHICPLSADSKKELETAKKEFFRKLDENSLEVRRQQAVQEAQISRCGIISVDKDIWKTKISAYHGNKMSSDVTANQITEKLTLEQLISMATGNIGKGQGGSLGSAGKSVPGSAAETSDCAIRLGVAPITLADGPAGLRLMKFYDVDKVTGDIAQKPFHFSLEGGVFYEDTGIGQGQERYYQYCTAIPVGTLLAQSFDTELVQEVGKMVGQELQEFRVTLWLAPGMNIHRNPLCGRNFEYYSEDPLLTGLMAAAMTNGVQSNAGVGTTIKHFACNNQEDNRMGCDSILSERALREIYLKGFEIAVKNAQPMAIMTSYNKINGIHAANHFDLCTKAARDEWGFQGVIMTDWTTTENGPDCTAAGCMRAGNDLVMPGCKQDHENLREELDHGTLSLEELKACVSHSIHIILQSLAYEDAKPYGRYLEEENGKV